MHRAYCTAGRPSPRAEHPHSRGYREGLHRPSANIYHARPHARTPSEAERRTPASSSRARIRPGRRATASPGISGGGPRAHTLRRGSGEKPPPAQAAHGLPAYAACLPRRPRTPGSPGGARAARAKGPPDSGRTDGGGDHAHGSRGRRRPRAPPGRRDNGARRPPRRGAPFLTITGTRWAATTKSKAGGPSRKRGKQSPRPRSPSARPSPISPPGRLPADSLASSPSYTPRGGFKRAIPSTICATPSR